MTLLSWYILWTTCILLFLALIYILSEVRNRKILDDIHYDIRFILRQMEDTQRGDRRDRKGL